MDFIELFKNWLKLKIKLWQKESKATFKQGEIWWCSLGFNLGEEIFGKGEKYTRPVLIYKKFTGNSFLGLPLSTSGKKGSWYVEITHANKKSYVLLNQARTLDKKRLTKRMSTLDKKDFKNVRERFIEFYGS